MNMKKISAVLVCAGFAAAFAQQPAEPVYVYHWLAGLVACEFAENGTQDPEMKEFEPYVKNGRLYFLGLGAPVKTGKLTNGFEFVFSEKHKVRGAYNGRQTDAINSTETLGVAGYAEKGKIIVTHVFFDTDSMEAWAKTVKLAFDE